MAVWQFNLTALEVVGEDDNGWPLTRIAHPTVRIDESSIIRLYWSHKERIREALPYCHDYLIDSYDRVDKDTGKDYAPFDNPREKLSICLNEAQRDGLERIQQQIFSKAAGDDSLFRDIRFGFKYDDSVHFLTDGVACFANAWHQDHGQRIPITTHEQAQKYIDALQLFYWRISPKELSVLCLKGPVLTWDELETIRSLDVPVRVKCPVGVSSS